jgi:hypothetical protein
MVEPVLGLGHLLGRKVGLLRRQRVRRGIRQRDDHLLLARLQIDPEDTRFGRRQVVGVRVRQAGITVAGPRVVDASEIGRKSRPAVGTQAIDRVPDRAALTRLDVHHVTHKPVVLPVVPENLPVGTGNPLQHATLLPAPRTALAQIDPTVPVLQIDHADPDHIVRARAAVLEVHLHPQAVAARRIKLPFVIVSEPMVLGPASDRALRRIAVRTLRGWQRSPCPGNGRSTACPGGGR